MESQARPHSLRLFIPQQPASLAHILRGLQHSGRCVQREHDRSQCPSRLKQTLQPQTSETNNATNNIKVLMYRYNDNQNHISNKTYTNRDYCSLSLGTFVFYYLLMGDKLQLKSHLYWSICNCCNSHLFCSSQSHMPIKLKQLCHL